MPAHIRRDYGPEHKARRRAWATVVVTGTVTCVFADTGECQYSDPLILPDQEWQLDHTYRGPAHQLCNEVAGARAGNATDRTRPWW